MRDFTLKKYKQLIMSLVAAGYKFMTFEDYCTQRQSTTLPEKFIILRHDVDVNAPTALGTALIEKELGLSASYYFRIVEGSNNPKVIRRLVDMGFEIGYHYEDLTMCNGDIEQAWKHFRVGLNYFREYYPIRTICMHGAARFRWDGRDLWKHYDYRSLGVIGEPYFDIDFSEVFYLTDTSRHWDGYKLAVRDKIPVYQEMWNDKGWVYHSTDDIIRAVQNGTFPQKVMLSAHSAQWLDNLWLWLKEELYRRPANIAKWILIHIRK